MIDTDFYSDRLRVRAINVHERRILITDFRGTDQESDLTLPPNCGGYGRVRHFGRKTSPGWPHNPLPVAPARRALGLRDTYEMQAQVFQNAACNWRCWYCYVPFELLAANEGRSAWFTADQLVSLYASERSRPLIVDLSGGQPDLVPEWIPWMMRALRDRGLERSTYLWSDDNLSTDYYTRFLSESTREEIARYSTYGRVGCFKGYNTESFQFNTFAAPEIFARQFSIFRALLHEGLDLYAYVTFTTPSVSTLDEDLPRFVDRLQEIHPNLPLRTVPLEIQLYTPVGARMASTHREAINNQWVVCEAWQREIQSRYTSDELSREIPDVSLSQTVP